jgi:leucyl aminopeptidase
MFIFGRSTAKRAKSDLLVVPFWKGKKEAELACDFQAILEQVLLPIKSGDFQGKEKEAILLYLKGEPESRILLLGLGEEDNVTVESLRRAAKCVTRLCQKFKLKEINFILPQSKRLDATSITRGVTEGIFLANYRFEQLKGKESLKEDATTLLEKVTLFGGDSKSFEAAIHSEALSLGVNLARDLVNGNADDVTPQHLGQVAKSLAKKYKEVKAMVHDKKWIEKEKMGLLLAVNQGSHREPAFIVVEYKGDPKSKDTTVVVGKGITYDTGGLNLKPTGSMETMKCDMSGAAAALGTILCCAELKIKKNVTAVIASTENPIGPSSYKPGDVVTSYLGKTVEIGNTDAEGRLILADAVAWACKNLKPSRMIDFATLTGAVVVAIGDEMSGLFTTNEALRDQFIEAGNQTYDRVWPLPLHEDYKDLLKSDIADMNNCGTARMAGATVGAIFIQAFVDEKIPWAHCDIAGTAFLKSDKRYLPKHATGVGVRLMIQFLENL